MRSKFNARGISRTPLLFVLLATLWGTSFVFIDIGLSSFPPLLFAAIRYDAAGLIVFAYAVVSMDRWRPRGRREWLSVALVGAFVIAGHHALLYLGTQHVSGALAAVVVSLTPILTAVFASVILVDERLDSVGVAGFAFGVLGVLVVADIGLDGVVAADAGGIGLVFLAAASFALGSVLARPVTSGLPAQTLQAWAMLFGAGLLHATSLLRGESYAAIEWSPPAVVSLVYLTLVSGVVAFLLYFHLLDRLGPSEINLVGYLEPVVATLMSWLLLGELVDSSTMAGFAAIFFGFALLKRDDLHRLVPSLSTEYLRM